MNRRNSSQSVWGLLRGEDQATKVSEYTHAYFKQGHCDPRCTFCMQLVPKARFQAYPVCNGHQPCGERQHSPPPHNQVSKVQQQFEKLTLQAVFPLTNVQTVTSEQGKGKNNAKLMQHHNQQRQVWGSHLQSSALASGKQQKGQLDPQSRQAGNNPAAQQERAKIRFQKKDQIGAEQGQQAEFNQLQNQKLRQLSFDGTKPKSKANQGGLSNRSLTKQQRQQIKRIAEQQRCNTRGMADSKFRELYGKQVMHNYGWANTSKINGGIIYGNYLKSMNINPHTMRNSPRVYQTFDHALEFAKRTKYPPETQRLFYVRASSSKRMSAIDASRQKLGIQFSQAYNMLVHQEQPQKQPSADVVGMVQDTIKNTMIESMAVKPPDDDIDAIRRSNRQKFSGNGHYLVDINGKQPQKKLKYKPKAKQVSPRRNAKELNVKGNGKNKKEGDSHNQTMRKGKEQDTKRSQTVDLKQSQATVVNQGRVAQSSQPRRLAQSSQPRQQFKGKVTNQSQTLGATASSQQTIKRQQNDCRISALTQALKSKQLFQALKNVGDLVATPNKQCCECRCKCQCHNGQDYRQDPGLYREVGLVGPDLHCVRRAGLPAR